MANSRTSAGASALISSDLIVEISPHWICRFHGTAAQLVAEGLIPDGFTWPTKTERVCWESGQFEYWLARTRPMGVKGPQSVWSSGDYWVVDKSTKAWANSHKKYLIEQKQRELAELVHGRSADWVRAYELAFQAKKDNAYQTFRAQVLGDLAPSKRGRAAKAAPTHTQTQGEAA